MAVSYWLERGIRRLDLCGAYQVHLSLLISYCWKLLFRLEKPLTPDVGSKLRDLALECSFIR